MPLGTRNETINDAIRKAMPVKKVVNPRSMVGCLDRWRLSGRHSCPSLVATGNWPVNA
jgi:hypothetical protein